MNDACDERDDLIDKIAKARAAARALRSGTMVCVQGGVALHMNFFKLSCHPNRLDNTLFLTVLSQDWSDDPSEVLSQSPGR